MVRTVQLRERDVARVYLQPDHTLATQLDPAWAFVRRQNNGSWRTVLGRAPPRARRYSGAV